jgi:hypothetical protein
VKINLRIDEIAVEGTSLTRREREHLTRTLEQELVRELRQRAAGQQGPPGRADRRDLGGPAGSTLGVRIAHDVLAALPAGILTGGYSGHRPRPGRRQSRRVMPGVVR